MQQINRSQILIDQEKRTTVWFLWLFYVIYFGYDIAFYYILPKFPWSLNTWLPGGEYYWMYIVMIGLVPIFIWLMKSHKPYLIKYILFITYTLINIINDVWFYWGSSFPYSSGNIVEVAIVMFSPIFVNNRFFYLVSLGTIVKYLIIGLFIQDSAVIFPAYMVIVLGMIAFLILSRFISYVDAVKTSYDKQIEGIVKGIIATLELKDPYTRGHSERVAEYARILAKYTGRYKEDELKSFYHACLLHDIGKINIPDSILTKPGRLTDEEMEIIKTHPAVGAKAVQQVEGIADNISVIRHHHERWDGKGYPDGLKGEETPFLARATALADAFDAMTSSRSYRAALPLEEAKRRIMEGRGSQFDPKLVDAFLEVFPNWVTYHNQYNSTNN
ncbi:HD domain-containing protein [Oceanobacillus piezotolerans]|uniref:HD domain-containing protein n=1 Tax=Oceanobacillus piezotolerans TaxID=2448030 RepID=A0A498DL35_9BACI|nr:HD-GYP domain-containing protein [Oceanobacillus piezotolerans]RLL43689.1 HD domain-containing protein [Oceanobacillus piezotolerans]